MRRMLVLLAVFLVASVCAAELSSSDALVTSDGGLSLTDVYNQTGPNAVDVATDGSATLTFIWFGANSRSTVDKSRVHYVRADLPPRSFDFAGGPDSVYVDLDSATEVIVSW